jgi:hypothetical protein
MTNPTQPVGQKASAGSLVGVACAVMSILFQLLPFPVTHLLSVVAAAGAVTLGVRAVRGSARTLGLVSLALVAFCVVMWAASFAGVHSAVGHG